MNVREEIKAAILGMDNSNILIELPTGYGKTLMSIELLRTRCKPDSNVLIVVPRTVLKKNYLDEVKKWWPYCPLNFVLTTYRSLHKYHGKWDAVVYDEAHHITPRCQEDIKQIHSSNSILLSATITKRHKETLCKLFNNLGCYKRTIKEAIDNGVLPDPKVYLLSLELDNTNYSEEIVWNPKARYVINTRWVDRWKYAGLKDSKVVIKCTKRQFMTDLDSRIEWWKKRYMSTKLDVFKNRWLHLCGDRLKILSNWRTDISIEILKKLKDYRTLTFCNSIDHTYVLGKNCINSKNKLSAELLDKFNTGKIKHITACNILNEGVNLYDCRVGIYAVLNSSETMIVQKLGRLLRHKNPVLIIPYYKGTREEEIVNTMITNCNPNLVEQIENIDEIKL